MNEKYNTFWRRFFAGIIDGIILLPINWFLHKFSFPGISYFLFSTIFWHTSLYTYSIWFHWKFGQTLGKRLLGVRVVDVGETRLLTLEQAVTRDSIPILITALSVVMWAIALVSGSTTFGRVADVLLDSVGVLWFLLEIFTMLTNDRRRAFHDYLAKSVVVRDEHWHGTRENVY